MIISINKKTEKKIIKQDYHMISNPSKKDGMKRMKNKSITRKNLIVNLDPDLISHPVKRSSKCDTFRSVSKSKKELTYDQKKLSD
jgi:hypothetical protein